METPDDG